MSGTEMIVIVLLEPEESVTKTEICVVDAGTISGVPLTVTLEGVERLFVKRMVTLCRALLVLA